MVEVWLVWEAWLAWAEWEAWEEWLKTFQLECLKLVLGEWVKWVDKVIFLLAQALNKSLLKKMALISLEMNLLKSHNLKREQKNLQTYSVLLTQK
jgi:hypothetical protein